MKIAIDIDGTLNNNIPWVQKKMKKFAKENGVKLKTNLTEYEFTDKFGISDKENKAFWEQYLWQYAKECPLKKGANKYINKLFDEGNEIVILSARVFANQNDDVGNKMRQCVVDWLAKYNIKYHKIMYVQANTSKFAVFKNEKFDILIDDKPLHMYEASTIKPCICMVEKYNKDLQFAPNVYKCKTWKDVYKTVKKIFEVK